MTGHPRRRRPFRSTRESRGGPHPKTEDGGFGRRLLVSIDAKGYGGGDDQRHVAVQDTLLAVLGEAASKAHLSRAEWVQLGAGDGELAILPSSEPEPGVVDDFV